MDIYLDNPNRAQRCVGLANNFAELRVHLTQQRDRVLDANERIYETINKMFATEGKGRTVDSVYQEALNSFSEEDRQETINLQQTLNVLNSRLAKAQRVSTVLGVVTSIANIAWGVQYIRLQVATAIILTGLVQFTTNAQDGAKLLQAGANMAHQTAILLTGAEGATNIQAALQFNRLLAITMNLGKLTVVLEVLTLVIFAGQTIYEAIEGGKRRSQLQDAIISLVALRFHAKKIEFQMEKAVSVFHAIDTNIMLESTIDQMVREGYMPPEKATEAKAKNMRDKVEPALKTAEKTDQEIWDILSQQDTLAHAWTKEDPTLQTTIDYLKSK